MKFTTALLMLASLTPLLQANQSKGNPNIIVILGDDIGWGDIGCYGATRIKTPHIDGLARDGLRFTDAHASAAVCTPTRYSTLTGQYSWRRNAPGLNKGVANADSPLLIPTDMETLPKILQQAGYRTGAIGKWHLGFGLSKPDYNQDLRPGPLEIGFDEFFGFPATNDRVPTVYVRDHRVINLDPADPIAYSYEKPPAGSPLSRFVASRNRIGWMSGGKAARWKDEELADTLTHEAVSFIEHNQESPFFLYFAPHDAHAPTIPHQRFKGRTGLGGRADMVEELDWSVGEILRTLDRLKLADETLVIFSSDNGASKAKEQNHRPNGPYRGVKSQLWEGGHRVPFIARWPGYITPGASSSLIGLVDLPATAAAIVSVELSDGAAPDSFNILPDLLGKPNPNPRDHLVVMSGKGDLAILQGPWKYIPDLSVADGWSSWSKKAPHRNATKLIGAGLYNLAEDPGENTNLAGENPETVQRLVTLLDSVQSNPTTRSPRP